MRLNQFHFLITIEEYHSISKAAAALFTSQPSISLAVQELETELGFPILIRTSKGVRFTKEGQLVLAEAKKIVASLNAITQIKQTLSDDLSLSLTIGCDSHFSSLMISDIAIKLRQVHPALVINSQRQTTLQTIKAVAEHTTALAIIHYNDFEQGQIERELARLHLQITPLFQDELCFVAHPGHPLHAKPQLCLQDSFLYPHLIDSDIDNLFLNNFFKQLPCNQATDIKTIQIEDIGTQRRYLKQSNAIQLVSQIGLLYGNKIFQDTLLKLNIADFYCNDYIVCITKYPPLTPAEEMIYTEIKNYPIQNDLL